MNDAKMTDPISDNILARKIHEHYYNEQRKELRRTHLGASVLGKDCARAIYFEHRWYNTDQFREKHRILRLFDTGKREEERVIKDLRSIGFMVVDSQLKCRDESGHAGGSIDGLITAVPEDMFPAWSGPSILEVKTHKDSSWNTLKNGVQKSFPEHYTQMQIYMGLMEVRSCLYVAVNKNTDDIYYEWIPFHEGSFILAMQKAEDVLNAKTIPNRIKEDPSWFICKMCSYRDVCHGKAAAEMNCRTCKFSLPAEEGHWECARFSKSLSTEEQLQGCTHHMPHLLG